MALLWPGIARAQVPEDLENQGEAAASAPMDDRFFADGQETEPAVDGSLSLTTFVFKELGGDLSGGGLGGNGPAGPISGSSPLARLYTDLRGRFDVERFAGKEWNARADFRARATGDDLGLQDEDRRTTREEYAGYEVLGQSGAFGGAELELRELVVFRDGEKWDIGFGRQHALDLAATRFDGARVVYHPSEQWRLMGFFGLYPSRLSRSIEDDYPLAAPSPADDTDPVTPGVQAPPGPRIFPITGGAGFGYQRDKLHGAFGVVAVAPLADDYQQNVMGTAEPSRVFLTSNGYYRPTDKLDLFHYAIFDVAGAAGARLSNGSLMAAFSPDANWRITGMVNHVDTVTLNVIAQTRLEDTVPPSSLSDDAGEPINEPAIIQNNAVVSRIAQDEARLSVSRALAEHRFELSVIGAFRRRPELEVPTVDGGTFVFPGAQVADATVRFVDRKSFFSSRMVVSASGLFGIGGGDLSRSDAIVGRVSMLRDFSDGKGELDLHLSYIHSRGADRGESNACDNDTLNGCYSSVLGHTVLLGATAFYRLADAWFVLGGATFGIQKLTTVYDDPPNTARPPIFMVTGFTRLAYRF